MDQNPVLAELLELAKRLAVRVRIEKLSTLAKGGGLIRLHGQPVVLLDSRCSAPEQIAVLTRVLAGFDTTPWRVSRSVAQLLNRQPDPSSQATPEPGVRSLLRAKPGLRRTRPSSGG